MLLMKIILLINILFFSYFKNIILPFKKITIEDFNGRKTINDFITYNIYTNVSMGTPPQTVAHFLDQNDCTFHFKKRLLSHNYSKFREFLGDFNNLTNFWFKNKQSNTFIMNENDDFCSDVFYFYTLNNTKITVGNLKYNMAWSNIVEKYKCGNIGFNNPSNDVSKNDHIHFLEELKQKEIISEYTVSVLYEEKNKLFDNNKEKNLGTLIIGESPHVFDPGHYREEEEIVYPGADWSILINEIYTKNRNYTENNIEIQFSLITSFIKGTVSYRKYVDQLFFTKLINDKKCLVELLEENVFPNEYYTYSCENNKEIQEKIKEFPNLNFEIKTNNLTFILTYNDLFKLYEDRIYFMVVFRDEKYSTYVPKWIMGEIFLRKYLTSFNYDSKTISFYRNQVNEMNAKIENKNKNGKNDDKPITQEQSSNLSKYMRIIIEIIMGIIIVFILYLLYRKYRKTRKIHANELEDSNYVYVSKDNENPIITDKKRELNQIIN
jgi:cell division protein FtsL